jgi:hypothetical protein
MSSNESVLDQCDECGGTGESGTYYVDGSPRPCGTCRGEGLVLRRYSTSRRGGSRAPVSQGIEVPGSSPERALPRTGTKEGT